MTARSVLGSVLAGVARPVLGQGAGFSIDAFMAAQSSRLYVDTTKTSTTWQDTSATTPADDVGEAIGRIDDAFTRTSSPANALQSSASLRPLRQTTGAKFDGSDDNLLTNYTAGSGANFMVALVDVPASMSVLQVVAGGRAASATRFILGFQNTAGFLVAGVGSVSVGSGGLAGSTARSGTEVVVGLSADGSTVRLFDGATLAAEVAQSGSIDTTIPWRIGCFNDNGAASTFFAGSIKKIVAGREFLTLERYLQIRNALLA